MFSKSIYTFILVLFTLQVLAQNPYNPNKYQEVWAPVPRKVDTGLDDKTPPSDAIVLYDGTSLDQWVSTRDGAAVPWTSENGVLTVMPKTGSIKTRQEFGDCQLHLEWRSPAIVEEEEGQKRGNSGVYIQSRYEVQILDSYNNSTYVNGQAGSIYKQHIPLVNASRKPGEWQTYDILFTAPKFNADSIKVSSGKVTVLHNGVLIQHNVELKGQAPHGKAPLMLQDHSDLVSFRNIWIRLLE
ncbi:DUF1080 domain-containing protein [Reichenbachiella sp. MALMAid0571]|uniref:3-keto-disaccharide hydrolase n=1 Tax=Reichenbachiella sp. MALMAid0571 TaxID=3143939 RepID=UPI0032DE8348